MKCLPCLLLASVIIGPACGEKSAVTMAPGSAQTFASSYSTYRQQLERADLAAVRNLKTEDLYVRALAAVKDDAWTVGNLPFSQVHERLLRAASGIRIVAAQYPTLGSLWDASGYDPSRVLRMSEYAAYLAALHQAYSGANQPMALGLVDGGCAVPSQSGMPVGPALALGDDQITLVGAQLEAMVPTNVGAIPSGLKPIRVAVQTKVTTPADATQPVNKWGFPLKRADSDEFTPPHYVWDRQQSPDTETPIAGGGRAMFQTRFGCWDKAGSVEN